MKDTDKSIEEVFFEMMMQKSGEERIRMGFEMFELAKKSIIASILHEKSGLSETEMKSEILKRCYGDALPSGIEEGFRAPYIKFCRKVPAGKRL
ncbi:MAG: hypothetical protein NTX36_07970 [Proteobacteria bacterium]|jgi:hypothetical protein|nr:hypothetical protein [Pseudomonadota bacterium]